MEGQQRQDATCRQRGKTGGEKTASILQFAHDNYKTVEVKTTDSATKSLTKLTAQDGKYLDIRYGIKLCNKNIGFNGKFYTFPYFLTFLLKRFVRKDL